MIECTMAPYNTTHQETIGWWAPLIILLASELPKDSLSRRRATLAATGR